MSSKHISRRGFLQIAGLGGAALFLNKPINALGLRSFVSTQMEPFMPDAEISVTAAEKYVQILSGAQTRVWSYEGQLLSGSGVTVQNLAGNYLGPMLPVICARESLPLRFTACMSITACQLLFLLLAVAVRHLMTAALESR